MTFSDRLAIAFGNLRRMKLRATLTIAGIVIAIGAFVAMLSFGAGSRRNVVDEYNKFGLFTTMQVYTQGEGAEGESPAVIDDEALAIFATLPGVNLVYPYDAIKLKVRMDSLTCEIEAQALTPSALGTKLFSQLCEGSTLPRAGERGVVATRGLVDLFALSAPADLLGRHLILSRHVASVDSGMSQALPSNLSEVQTIINSVNSDSVRRQPLYLRRLVEGEVSRAAGRFFTGFMQGAVVTDTVTVVGVLKARDGQFGLKPLLLPLETATTLLEAGPSADPISLFADLKQGKLLGDPGGERADNREYPKATLDIEQHASYALLSDTLTAMGYSSFSYAADFEQIRRIFIIFDLLLGIVGLIALITAALGIVNTMVMAITERRREIGIFKSLGANENDIRDIFLLESGLIGAVGATIGILLGWGVSRIASLVAKEIMRNEGVEPVELFTTPPALIAVALTFGILISLIAGAWPATRAARVDPVAALRGE
ncbi:MAG: ABC transporter permease [bacterium]|nr:ABC transporter permease [bacterium]